MSIYVKDSGNWSLASNVYVNNSGTWIEPREIYTNNSGTWTLTHKVVWITVSTNNLDLYSFVGSPSSTVRVLAHITSNVVISSNSTSYPSLTVTGFPANSQIKLVNYGVVKGAGGAGGKGADYGGSATAGSVGGTAVAIGSAVTIENNGTFAGGGGGGGGGGYYSTSSSCFPGNALVSTPDGLVKIKDLTVGDIVYAYDATGLNYSSALFKKRVTETFVHTWEESGSVSPLLVITHEHGALTTTINHHIMTSSRASATTEADAGFVQADELQVGDIIYLEDGSATTIVNIEAGVPYDFVYNLTVEDFHTFVADGIRVHNKGGGKGTSYYYYGGGGAGGGAGVANGSAGAGGTGGNGNGANGSAGSASAGGAGGAGGNGSNGTGGTGGALGASGNTGADTNAGAGGAAGYYITGNTNVTWTGTGTLLGSTA
jgi:Pretoxin HINT domain/Phage tail fibre adhesin Gp38